LARSRQAAKRPAARGLAFAAGLVNRLHSGTLAGGHLVRAAGYGAEVASSVRIVAAALACRYAGWTLGKGAPTSVVTASLWRVQLAAVSVDHPLADAANVELRIGTAAAALEPFRNDPLVLGI